MGRAVDAERVTDTRYHEQKRHSWIAHYVAQRVDTVVAAPVREHQRPGVMHAHEAGDVTAWRAI